VSIQFSTFGKHDAIAADVAVLKQIVTIINKMQNNNATLHVVHI